MVFYFIVIHSDGKAKKNRSKMKAKQKSKRRSLSGMQQSAAQRMHVVSVALRDLSPFVKTVAKTI